MSSVCIYEISRLKSVTNEKVELIGTNDVPHTQGKTPIRVILGIVKNLTVRILFGTSFTDKFLKEMLSTGRKIFLDSLQPV